MNNSEQIGELITALAVAQGQIKNAIKDSENPFFKSSYADLKSVWDACREPLSKNGLAIIQTVNNINGTINITTLLGHKSGQYISDILSCEVTKKDPQSLGSLITYLRRYSLASFVGVAPEDEDDDGEKAMKRGSEELKKENKKTNGKEEEKEKLNRVEIISRLGKMLIEMSGADVNIASDFLFQASTYEFTDEAGVQKVVEGFKSLKDITDKVSDKRIYAIYGKIKAKHKEFQEHQKPQPQNVPW